MCILKFLGKIPMKEVRNRYIFVYISQNYHVFYLFLPNFAIKSEQKVHIQFKKEILSLSISP